MAWLSGAKVLNHRRWLEQIGPIGGPLVWHTPAPPNLWPVPRTPQSLCCSPFKFILAASRATVLASASGWSGHLAASFGALTAWSLLDPRAASSPNRLMLSPNIDQMKDYFGMSAKGTIGAAIAILEMQAAGYPWFGHWEDAILLPGVKAPDFIFGHTNILAAVEAKCTEQHDPNLVKWLKDAWRGQVRDAGAWGMNEGWVIATCFNDPAGAAIECAYGAFPAPRPPGGARAPGNVPNNFVTLKRAMQSALTGVVQWISPRLPIEFDRENRWPVTRLAENLLRGMGAQEYLFGTTIECPTNDNRLVRMTPLCKKTTLEKLLHGLALQRDVQMPEAELAEEIDLHDADSIPVDVWLNDGTGARFTIVDQ